MKVVRGVARGRYYEAHREGRGRQAETVVKIWLGPEKQDEPAHEWVMPGVLPLDVAVDQAILEATT